MTAQETHRFVEKNLFGVLFHLFSYSREPKSRGELSTTIISDLKTKQKRRGWCS